MPVRWVCKKCEWVHPMPPEGGRCGVIQNGRKCRGLLVMEAYELPDDSEDDVNEEESEVSAKLTSRLF